MITEQAPAVIDEGALYHTDPDKLCHLYRPLEQTAVCGFPRQTHTPVEWEKGNQTCPRCGNPICMDCTLEVG